MLARTLMIAAMVVALYYLYRRWADAKKITPEPPKNTQPMKRCEYCGLHLPEKEALSQNQLYFCSEEHKTLYLQEHR